MYLLGPPSVADDGRVVFKALLDQNKTPLAGIFQWTTGASPTLIMGTSDPRDLIGWAAGKLGLNYILVRPQGGVGRLYVGMGGLVPAPVSPSGLTDLTDLALNSNGDIFVAGSGPNGTGVFQLVGSQYTPMPVAVKAATQVPPIPGILGAGYTFDGVFFNLVPTSLRGRLIFRATIAKGGDTKLGEFAFGASGLVSRQVAVLLSSSARTLISSSLGNTPPSQNRNGITISANPGSGRWSLVLFRGDSPPQTIVREGQMLPNGTQIKVLDAGPLLQQETDPVFHNGPVFTIDDAGNVAFLASDGQGWGVYQVPTAAG
jgi:hypothetical protein